MKVCIIGGTGRIGNALIPLVTTQGHQVLVVARGEKPLPQEPSPGQITFKEATYQRRDRTWYQFLEALEADVVIDLLGLDPPGVYQSLRGRIQHFIVTGPFRMYGEPRIVPTPEEMQGTSEFPELARRYQETVGVQHQARQDGVAFTAVVLPTVTGPGYVPPDLRGGADVAAHRVLRDGKTIRIPFGANALIAPCDVQDIARGILHILQNRNRAADEIFNIGPPYAITLETLIGLYATAYQVEFPIEYITWEDFLDHVVPRPDQHYFFRVHESPDIRKIQSRLQFEPHYTPEESVERSIRWMLEQQLLENHNGV